MLMSSNKDDAAVHGFHCPGDMAVHMRKVMAIPRVGVRVCHLLHLLNRDITYSSGRKSAHCLTITKDDITFFLPSPDDQSDVHGVFQELWYKIPSGSIASLRADSRFPNNPDVVNILQNFDAPFNFHTNYGQRLTAYLQVNYIFYGTKK